MKIVIIGPAYPYRGGIASFSVRMAKALQQDGHDVTIYTFTMQYPDFLFPGKTQYAKAKPPKDVRIVRCINSANPLNWFKVGMKLRKEAPDLLIVKYWLPFMAAGFGTILRRVKKNKQTKIIGFLHNVIPHEKRIGDLSLTKYFLQPVDGFVALSKAVLEDLNQFNKNKPRAFNPHPIFDHFGTSVSRKAAAERLQLDDRTKYLLFFGIVRDYKGLDWLLKAFSRTKSKKDVKLIIAGEYYADEEEYQKLIDQLGLREKVVVRNYFIKEEEVKYYFSLANLVTQPYKNATQSGVTQIAYHFSCPMLVTKVGGLPEMIPHNKVGLVVEPNIESIAEAIDLYFENNLEESFRNHFAEEKKKYSWERLNATIYKVYRQIK